MALVLALVFGPGASTALAGSEDYKSLHENPIEESTSPAALDVLVLRPLGIVGLAISTGLFLAPVAPLTLITKPGEIGAPFDKMVMDPVRYLVKDPIGEH